MPKKIIPVPSDFARPKPGAYLKKGDAARPKPAAKKAGRPKPTRQGQSTAPGRTARPAAGDGPRFDRSEHRPGTENKRPGHVANRSPQRTPHEGEQKRHATHGKPFAPKEPPREQAPAEKMPLNKYIAHCGICSRRDAIPYIKEGKVKVNGKVETEPGYKVVESDVILLEDKKIVPQVKLVYYLLNKPKDYITTTDDPNGRKTVMDLMKPVAGERIYPVGRLDRNTTGLLLLTNDGELAQKLSHPSHGVRKVYQVSLDRPLAKKDFDAIARGLMLEDGLAPVDEIAYVNPEDKREIGIEIHLGRNRIVRRIFEHLDYEVRHLDRVIYAGLTKKNLPRGKYRELEPKELIFLKHFK